MGPERPAKGAGYCHTGLKTERAEWDNNPAALACMKRAIFPGLWNDSADREKEAHHRSALKKAAKAELQIFDEQERDHP